MHCSSPFSVTSNIFLFMHLFFLADIIISFRVAYNDGEVLVTDSAATAKNYLRWEMFAGTEACMLLRRVAS
jgi:hypothetical protein